jgi:hypothetical protein
VGDRGGEQRDGQAAVLLAGCLDEAAGVLAVGAAGRVDQQAEQALGLGPALDRVFLVRSRDMGKCQTQPGPVAAADRFGQGLEQDLVPTLVQRPRSDVSIGVARICRISPSA